jgi:hypothetical protein
MIPKAIKIIAIELIMMPSSTIVEYESLLEVQEFIKIHVNPAQKIQK